jgi:hypothetical protein
MPDSAIRPVDLIIGRSLLTAESVMQELRERLLALPYSGYLSQEQLIQAARNILDEYEPLITENLANADLASWIAGMDRVSKSLPEQALQKFAPFWRRPPNDPPRLPPLLTSPGGEEPEELTFPIIREAAANLFERQILTPTEFYAAQSRERDKAFTVARESREDVLERIRDRLAEDVREGTSLKSFRDSLEGDLQSSFISPAHIETVYRTNVQAAFREGQDRIASNPIVAEIFPYRTWDAVHDARTRKTHLALEKLGLSGTNVYRADDPFWKVWKQPAGYNCRCGSTYLTIEAAARKGVDEAKEWLRSSRKPVLESRLPHIPFEPEPGFARVAA